MQTVTRCKCLLLVGRFRRIIALIFLTSDGAFQARLLDIPHLFNPQPSKVLMWYDNPMAKKQARLKPASSKGWRTHLGKDKSPQELPDTSMIAWLPKISSSKVRKR